MDSRKKAKRTLIIVGILVLSLLCGFLYQSIGHSRDVNSHPREFEEYVTKYATENGVPEYIAYAVLLNLSDFRSNQLTDDGRVGLYAMTPAVFDKLTAKTGEELESGMLYDPETNIRYGLYYLSTLYTTYNRWKTVFAIVVTDEDTVLGWMNVSANIDENGNLVRIPDSDVSRQVEQMEKDYEIYRELYYTK